MIQNEQLESFLDAKVYIEPKDADVNVNANTIVSMILPDNIDSLYFDNEFYYKPGRLSLSDGSAVPDNSRIYFIQDGESIQFFFPQSLREYIEKTKNVTWNGNGNLLWWILQDILTTEEYNSITECRLNKNILEKLLGTYIDSEGKLVKPST